MTLSVGRLKEMTSGSRVLVLLTDGHDLGSQSSLQQAIAAAQEANVVRLRDRRRRTHRREAPDGPRLGNRRQALRCRRRHRPRRRLPRRSAASSTERGSSPISPPPARVTVTRLSVRAAGAASTTSLRIPEGDEGGGLVPRSVAGSPITAAAVVGLAALLFAAARLRRPPSPPLVRDHPPARAAL